MAKELGSSTTGTIFGYDRIIRSDEWAVLTPFAISQEHIGYSSVSAIIRGGDTDTTLIYALPSWSVATFFRPELWGYLFFGPSKGLAFFWSLRNIALFLATFECARIYSYNNKYLSAVVATLVTFAPVVQWWFAVNGIAELFIFGQIIVVSLYKYIRASSLKSKIGWGCLLAWSSGCFVLILYPAWQIPVFYIIAGLCLWVIIVAKKEHAWTFSHSVSCWLALVLPCVMSVLMVGFVFANAKDALVSILNTVYPGDRFSTGGDGLNAFLNYACGLALPLTEQLAGSSNNSEMAMFFSFFLPEH